MHTNNSAGFFGAGGTRLLSAYRAQDGNYGGIFVLPYWKIEGPAFATVENGVLSDLYRLALKDDLPQAGSTVVVNCPAGTIKEVAVAFPKAFTTAPAVAITPLSDTQGINGVPKYSVKNVTTTGFSLKVYNDDNTERSPGFYWMAMPT